MNRFDAWVPNAWPEIPRVGSRLTDEILESIPDEHLVPLRGYPVASHLAEPVLSAVEGALSHPTIAPALGLISLREALAALLSKQSNRGTNPQNIAVTSGAMEALQLIWLSLASGGSRVLVPVPTYFVEGSIRLAGLAFQPVSGLQKGGWDWDKIEGQLTADVTALFLCNPNNPTGDVFDESDLLSVAQITRKNPELWVVIDESYERMIFDDRRHISGWNLSEETDRIVVVRSFSKSFAVPWLRVGWLATPSTELIARIRNTAEWMRLCGVFLTQATALAVVGTDGDWITREIRKFADQRRLFHDLLAQVREIRLNWPAGGPFLFPEVLVPVTESDIFGLVREGVPVVPGGAFGLDSGWFRIPFGGNPADLHRAKEILQDWLASLNPGSER